MESNIQFVLRSQTVPQKEESNGGRSRVTVGTKEAGLGGAEHNLVDPLVRGWEEGTEEEASEEFAIE